MADAKYDITLKNTFLHFQEDIPTIPRSSSWTCGETPDELDLGSDDGSGVPCSSFDESEAAQDLHSNGKCKPCVFLASRFGCARTDCAQCHLLHEHRGRIRPKKSTRKAFKHVVEKVFERLENLEDTLVL
ncbi:unnamed protein product [Durusdinium trenchii]|uniref:C3H1-type domain-containing protein n=1 Tax=Durusdinium trenchii TaxID=1381693 RepID=A0ABP0T151_9DINO